jgi:hypothetical protein
MVKDYVIAIGGTGARCLEAVIHLSAAGMFSRPMHLLMIDPDQNNGNTVRTRNLLPMYHTLHRCDQPRDVKQRKLLTRGKGPAPQVTFRPSINLNNQNPPQQQPAFWQDPNKPDRAFGEAIGFSGLSTSFKDFVQLFYEHADLDMKLGKGYRGRPNVGAVVLISDLKRTLSRKGNGLSELIDAMRADLKSDIVRVFVFGSVFGGTGAAGLPTIPELLREFFEENGENEKLRIGCAMMTPYFTFPKAETRSTDGPAPDPNIHQVATQAALLHYAHVPPGYQHVYVVGAPELVDSKIGHQPGGGAQENDPHFAEIIAAFGARDFFSLPVVDREERQLHYADAVHFDWKSLPAADSTTNDQLEVKLRLLAFTTFAYLYRNILHVDLKDGRWRSKQAWYKDNFTRNNLTLENSGAELDMLNDFFGDYLNWLDMVGQPIRGEQIRPFNWEAIALTGKAAERELGKLSTQESEETPRYARNGYGRIIEKLSYMRPRYTNNVHPVGLLIYLLSQAAREFTAENYYLSSPD